MGNAPTMGTSVFAGAASGFTVYYYNGATNFSTPTWDGYPSVKLNGDSPLAAWLLSNGLPYNANLQSAPNGDGVSLLMAYAFNLNPTRNQSACLPRPTRTGNNLGVTFYAGSAGVTYFVEASTDLVTWSTAGVTVSAPDANNCRTATVPATGPNTFMRLKVVY